MPVKKAPGPGDAAAVTRMLLGGLADGMDVLEIAAELAPLHPRNDTFPGEVFLQVAGGALGWCGVSRADPVPLEGIRERFLAECSFRGLYAAVAFIRLAASRAGVPVSQVCREPGQAGLPGGEPRAESTGAA